MNVLSSRLFPQRFAASRVALPSLLLGTAAVLAATSATAQYVKGNEAVQTTYSGARQVETPPVPRTVGKPCAPADGCHAGSWRMVETDRGLSECTEPWARNGSCRPSTYGAQKLRRVWVVKRNSSWLQCQYPDLDSKCVSMSASPPANLPFDAVQ